MLGNCTSLATSARPSLLCAVTMRLMVIIISPVDCSKVSLTGRASAEKSSLDIRRIQTMNAKRIDLNLLVSLEALLRDANVSHAATG
jgi:hypothetical protein